MKCPECGSENLRVVYTYPTRNGMDTSNRRNRVRECGDCQKKSRWIELSEEDFDGELDKLRGIIEELKKWKTWVRDRINSQYFWDNKIVAIVATEKPPEDQKGGSK